VLRDGVNLSPLERPTPGTPPDKDIVRCLPKSGVSRVSGLA
jgi:hypothetical protein